MTKKLALCLALLAVAYTSSVMATESGGLLTDEGTPRTQLTSYLEVGNYPNQGFMVRYYPKDMYMELRGEHLTPYRSVCIEGRSDVRVPFVQLYKAEFLRAMRDPIELRGEFGDFDKIKQELSKRDFGRCDIFLFEESKWKDDPYMHDLLKLLQEAYDAPDATDYCCVIL